jgi:uncharacterized membrane protein
VRQGFLARCSSGRTSQQSLWRFANRDGWDAAPVGPLVLSIVGLAIVGVSGFLGGKLAYHYGVRVADEATQADGFEPTRPGRP